MVAGLGEADKLIIFGADAVGGGDINDVGAEFFFNAGNKLVAAGVGALVDEVNAGLVKGDGVGGVALHDGAVDVLNKLLDVFGAEVVLVALLAGVEFDGGWGWQGELEGVVDFDEAGGGNVRGEINFGFGHSDAPYGQS